MKHVVYTEDVHIQSYANLVLLQRLYTQIESNRWSKVRKQFLEEELRKHNKLTCYYCNNSKLKLKSNKRHEQATVDHIIPRSGGGEEFNSEILEDPSRSLLANYLGRSSALFSCPADRRIGTSTAPRDRVSRRKIKAARSFAASQAVGTDPNSRGLLSVDGPWLDGNHGHTRNKTWFCYGKLGDFTLPGAASTFVFVDEDDKSLNDGGFAVIGPPSDGAWKEGDEKMIDWPAWYHNGAAGFAFADGHSEIKRWTDVRTRLGAMPQGVPTQKGNKDIRWMSERTSARVR